MRTHIFVLFKFFFILFCSSKAVSNDDPSDSAVFKSILSDTDINENYYLLQTIKNQNRSENYRLPKTVLPETYNITVDVPFDENFTFNGIVEINATVVEITKEISLHYQNLNVTDCRVYSEDHVEMRINHTVYNAVTNIFTLVLKENLPTQSHILIVIKYEGILSDDCTGLYKSSYYDSFGNRRWLAATQFEPVYARKAFPCFDEPGFKAKFNLNIRTSKNYTVLSNMPKIATRECSDSVLDTFAETPRMSSYIIAIVISDFSSLSLNGSNVHIWSKYDIIKNGYFALNFGTKVLDTFGKLFNMTNPVPKTDMVAVPDFNAGAMENWGLITYREHILTYEENENVDSLQLSVGGTVAHELAHMWFGNMLSPEWWEFTWLNEGFANYFQHIGSLLTESSWKSDGLYLADVVRKAFYYDSSKYSLSISHTCATPTEISKIFGKITYQKGGSVIRMMSESFSPKIFYGALQEYIAENMYNNVRSDHLWKAIQNQVNKYKPDLKVPIKDIMSNWINEPGHPVLTVEVKENQIHLSQKRFLLQSEPGNETWYIPITYTLEKNPNFTHATTNLWMKDNMTIDVVNATKQWVVFNILGAGFYRVNYDLKSWYRIIRTLNSKKYADIHEFNRVVIIDDLFNLARGGYIDYDVVLDAIQYLPYEKNYLVIKTALNGLQFLSHRFSGHKDEQLLNNHIMNLIEHVYKDHGYFDNKNNSKYTIFLRAELNALACKLNHTKCIAKSVKSFAKWRKNEKNKIPKNQRPISYCYALQEGSAEDWEFLYEQYHKTSNAHERLIILKCLGCTQNHTLLDKYLLNAMTDYDAEHQIHRQDSLGLFQTVAQNGIKNAKYMLSFLTKYQDKVNNYFKSNNTVVQLMLLISRSFTTQERIDEFQQYIDENSIIYKPILPHLQQIKMNAIYELRWYEKYSSSIIKWLYKTYP